MPHVIPVSRIRALFLGLALLSLGGRAVADTIVLKNGRRILALSAVEEGDKVKYLTTAGELSLPKSIVDHIEKGSGALMTGSPGADAANLAIAPPAMKTTGASAELERWAYYGLNKLDQAVAEWKRALALRPDQEVQVALDKALADKTEEESYKENESSHFKLRYSGAAAPALARDVLRTLERHYSEIESELNFSPPESIGVILYTQDAFSDITKAPAWAGALNDGRIRVPVQGLAAVDAELSPVLRHELTHSFIAQKTRSACMGLAASCAIRAPTWIQEGLAQWIEGQRSREDAAILLQIYSGGHAIPLSRLEGSWLNMGGDTARYAYAWALANIEYIEQAGGMVDIERILDRIGAGMGTEAALREVLHGDYSDLMQSTAEYLRKTYVR